MTNTRIVRAVELFEKKGDELVESYELHSVDLSFLQDLFEQDKNDPMIEGFRINKEQAEKLNPFVNAKIDTEKISA